MKKTIITMLIALVAMFASAETYSYLKFTMTDGTTLTYSAQGIKLTYDASSVYVSNNETTATIALANVQDMYFSNEEAPSVLRGDVDNDGIVNIADVTALVDYVLTHNVAGINIAAADCDQDGEVSIADITALVDYILAGNW